MLALAAMLGTLPVLGDDRSTELMRYECSSSLTRRDVTLFANGTVRLRQGPLDEQALFLDELLPEELASYLKQLRDVQASAFAPSVDLAADVPSGDWVEDCEIRLALPGAEPAAYFFSVFEVPPLVVAGLIHVAEDLASFTRVPADSQRLPTAYRPRRGDVLLTADGEKFRVMDLTGDGLGVELEELGSPVMIVVPLSELGDFFAALQEPGR